MGSMDGLGQMRSLQIMSPVNGNRRQARESGNRSPTMMAILDSESEGDNCEDGRGDGCGDPMNHENW
jgi:hypothetical protein